MNTRQMLQAPIALLIFTSVLLPSGAIYGLNVKFAVCALSFLIFIWFLVRLGVNKTLVYAPVSLFAWLLFYCLIALVNGIDSQDMVSHAVAIMSLFLLIFTPVFSVRHGIFSPDGIVKVVFISLAVFALFKVLMSLVIWYGISSEQVRSFYESVFGVSFIGLDTGYFYRVHLASDFLLPLAIYAILSGEQVYIKSKYIKWLLMFVIFLAVIVSYSRILYAYSLLSVALWLVLEKRVGLKVSILVCAILVSLVYVLYSGGGFVADFVYKRYSGEFADSSDATRGLMLDALINTFMQNPIFGRGLGAGTIGYTNIQGTPWYFELQWLSFLMQFGVFGFILLLLLALSPVSLMVRKLSSYNVGLLVLYLFWLAVGIFNGFMLTSSGGVIFLAFIMIFYSGFGFGRAVLR